MTLEKLSDVTFYQMGNYSQFTIDLVQTIEDDIEEMTKEQKISQVYLLENILEIINPDKTFDVEAIKDIIKILET